MSAFCLRPVCLSFYFLASSVPFWIALDNHPFSLLSSFSLSPHAFFIFLSVAGVVFLLGLFSSSLFACFFLLDVCSYSYFPLLSSEWRLFSAHLRLSLSRVISVSELSCLLAVLPGLLNLPACSFFDFRRSMLQLRRSCFLALSFLAMSVPCCIPCYVATILPQPPRASFSPFCSPCLLHLSVCCWLALSASSACFSVLWCLFSHFLPFQTKCAPTPDYMQYQKEVNEKMRTRLIDWLVDVHFKFKVSSVRQKENKFIRQTKVGRGCRLRAEWHWEIHVAQLFRRSQAGRRTGPGHALTILSASSFPVVCWMSCLSSFFLFSSLFFDYLTISLSPSFLLSFSIPLFGLILRLSIESFVYQFASCPRSQWRWSEFLSCLSFSILFFPFFPVSFLPSWFSIPSSWNSLSHY